MFGTIKNQQGETIDYTFHVSDMSVRQVVVIGHGVTGNKDRPFVIALAEGLKEAGVNALRFSFSGNGESEGQFEESTVSKEVDDLISVIDTLKNWHVTYAGHSMGGAVGVLAARQDTRIQRLISLAGMVHTEAFAQREFADIKPDHGFMWEEETCPLSQTYMNDMKTIGSVIEKGAGIKVPWLIIHGTEDDVVPIQDSKDMLQKAPPRVDFVEIPGSDHVFSGDATPVMVKAVTKWLVDTD